MPFFLQETNKWWLPGAVAKRRWFRLLFPERRWSSIPVSLGMNIASSVIQSVSSVVLSSPRTLISIHNASFRTGPFAEQQTSLPLILNTSIEQSPTYQVHWGIRFAYSILCCSQFRQSRRDENFRRTVRLTARKWEPWLIRCVYLKTK